MVGIYLPVVRYVVLFDLHKRCGNRMGLDSSPGASKDSWQRSSRSSLGRFWAQQIWYLILFLVYLEEMGLFHPFILHDGMHYMTLQVEYWLSRIPTSRTQEGYLSILFLLTQHTWTSSAWFIIGTFSNVNLKILFHYSRSIRISSPCFLW